MTNKERIKELMKDYGQLERQAKAAFKKADDAHAKLWQSADGSAEAKKWNAEWKKQEAAAVEFRRKANVILDRVERLKEENPMPAKKQITKRKASKKGPSPAQLRARKAFAAAAKARSKAAKKNAAEKPKRQNKTIITKPKKVVVINKLKNGKAILPTRYKWSHVSGNQIRWVMEYDMYGDGDLHVYERTYPSLSGLLTDLRNKFGAGFANKIQKEIQPKKNPGKSTRRKYRNGYLDLVIMGHAKKTPSGWLLGGKTFKQGKGIVPASRRGYYLDLGTGTVFSKKARNVAQGFFDGNGVFHPIRSSSDYDPGTAGETGKKPVRTRSKKRKVSLKKAGQTARLKAETKRRKSTASRLASRSLSKSAGILKGSGSRQQRRNPVTQASWRSVHFEEFEPALNRWFSVSDRQVESETGLKKLLAEARRKHYRATVYVQGSGYPKQKEKTYDYSQQKKNPNLTIIEKGKHAANIAFKVGGNRATEQAYRAIAKQVRLQVYPEITTLKDKVEFEQAFKTQIKTLKKGRTNPSVKSIRKEFAGTVGKASDVFAPIGTPRNVAKLGKLLLIDTEKATIKPTGIVYLCADSKGKLHLCGSKNVPIYSGAAQSFGQVKKLEYETAKPHLYPGQGTISFWHKMGEESGNRPTLYADGKGGLKFRGGSYRITREGIVD